MLKLLSLFSISRVIFVRWESVLKIKREIWSLFLACWQFPSMCKSHIWPRDIFASSVVSHKPRSAIARRILDDITERRIWPSTVIRIRWTSGLTCVSSTAYKQSIIHLILRRERETMSKEELTELIRWWLTLTNDFAPCSTSPCRPLGCTFEFPTCTDASTRPSRDFGNPGWSPCNFPTLSRILTTPSCCPSKTSTRSSQRIPQFELRVRIAWRSSSFWRGKWERNRTLLHTQNY